MLSGVSFWGVLGETAHASRGAMLLSPPPFPEKISCLALIIGVYCDSGRDPGFGQRGKEGKSRPVLERFWGEMWALVPDSRFGVINGRFCNSCFLFCIFLA